jgi:hypothetical protein
MNTARRGNNRRKVTKYDETQRQGKLARTRNGFVQNSNATSHRDNVPQVRKFLNYQQLAYTNSSGDFSFGVATFHVTPVSTSAIGRIIGSYENFYEQYRIRRITVRAQCGKGYTNDRRVQTFILARVDVDNSSSAATFDNFRAIAACENTVCRTLTEKGNIELCNYRPIMFDQNFTSNAVVPVLPSHLQWHRITDRANHQWRGAQLACAIPDNTLVPSELKITLQQELIIEFRGRIQAPGTITGAAKTIETLNEMLDDMEVSKPKHLIPESD